MGQSACAQCQPDAAAEAATGGNEDLTGVLDELAQASGSLPVVAMVAKAIKDSLRVHADRPEVSQRLQLLGTLVASLAPRASDEASRALVRDALSEAVEVLGDLQFREQARRQAPEVQVPEAAAEEDALEHLRIKLATALSHVLFRQSSCSTCAPRRLPPEQVDHSQLRFHDDDLGTSSLAGRGHFQVCSGSLVEVGVGGRSSARVVAVKVHDQGQLEDLWDAVEANSRLQMDSRHPNVLRILGACKAHPSFPGAVLLVRPYMSLGSLRRVLFDSDGRQAGSEAELARRALGVPPCAAQVLFGVASALEYMHGRDPAVPHLALKAENVLLEWAAGPVLAAPAEHHMLMAQLCDFQAFPVYRALALSRAQGAATHAAPEQWRREEGADAPPADVFAFGLLLSEVSAQRRAFDQLPDHQVMAAVCGVPPALPSFDVGSSCYDQRYEALAERCWVKDPAGRATMREAAREIERVARESARREALRRCLDGGAPPEELRREVLRSLAVLQGGDPVLDEAAARLFAELRKRDRETVSRNCALLVKCLEQLARSESVQEACCGALLGLCSGTSSAGDQRYVEQVLEAGCLPALTTSLTAQRQSAAVLERGFAVLRVICGRGGALPSSRMSPGAETNRRVDAAVGAGALEAVVQGLWAHPAHEGVQAEGCGALQSLTVGEPSRKDRAADAGALEVLVVALRRHLGCAAVQERAPAAIRNVCVGTDLAGGSRARRAAEAGALEALVDALKANAGNPVVQEKASAALRNICAAAGSAAPAERAAEVGALEALAACLRRHVTEVQMVDQACSAIQSICSGHSHDSRNARLARAAEAGAIEAMVVALRAHAGHRVLQGRVLATLRDTCAGGDPAGEARAQRAVGAGALEVLVAALRAHPEDEALQRRGCGALHNMCISADVEAAGRAGRAAEAGALEVLFAAMRTHVESVELQELACIALQGFLARPPLGAGGALARRAVEAGALDAIAAALQAHSGSTAVQEKGCRCLRDLCCGEDADGAADARAAQAGVLDGLVAALSAPGANAIAQEHAVETIQHFCDAAAAGRERLLADAEGLKAFVAAWHETPDVEARRKALSALRSWCAESPEFRGRAVADGIDPDLIQDFPKQEKSERSSAIEAKESSLVSPVASTNGLPDAHSPSPEKSEKMAMHMAAMRRVADGGV